MTGLTHKVGHITAATRNHESGPNGLLLSCEFQIFLGSICAPLVLHHCDRARDAPERGERRATDDVGRPR